MIDINTFKEHYPRYPTIGELGLKYPDPNDTKFVDHPGDTSSLTMRIKRERIASAENEVNNQRLKMIPAYIKSDKLPSAFVASSEFKHTFISGTFFKKGIPKETSDYSFKEFCDKCNFYEVAAENIYFKNPKEDPRKIYAEFNVKQSITSTSKIVDITRVKPKWPYLLRFYPYGPDRGYEIQQNGEMKNQYFLIKDGKVVTNKGPMIRIVMYVLKHDIDIEDIFIGTPDSDRYHNLQGEFFNAAEQADEYLKPHKYDIDALFADRKAELAKKKA